MKFSYNKLVYATQSLLISSGAPRGIANIVAQVLINAEVVGHKSHGINALFSYLKGIEEGSIKPQAEPRIVLEDEIGILIDGYEGLGPYTAYKATEIAIEKAKKKGSSLVWIRNMNNIGRAGEYIEKITSSSCIGLIMAGSGNFKQESVVSPSKENICRLLGTNPIAFGVPTNQDPFIIDLATSETTYHNIQMHYKQKINLPEKSIINKKGRLTADPQEFYDGGAILPFGGYKGFALSLIVSLLSGFASYDITKDPHMRGVFMLVIDIEKRNNSNVYKEKISQFLDVFREAFLAESEIRIPYDKSLACKEENLKNGIYVQSNLISEFLEWAKKLKCDGMDEWLNIKQISQL